MYGQFCAPPGADEPVGVEWPLPRHHQTMALTAGTRLGHSNVSALIGEGGMGRHAN